MDDKSLADAEMLAQAKDLVASLENGDDAGAKEIIDDLTRIRETDLYQEMGKLTRELHDAIMAFGMDEQIANLAQSEIPDARQRLRYVIEMTDQAAHRTLNEVEESLPICEQLESRSRSLQEDWQRFTKRDMNINEFKQLAKSLDEFFSVNTGDAGKLRDSLNNVLMAQDFQDLTSQIIKKVIRLVEEVETNLVGLIKLTKSQEEIDAMEQADKKKDSEELAGPIVPGVNNTDGTVSGQDEVDDLLSSLGF